VGITSGRWYWEVLVEEIGTGRTTSLPASLGVYCPGFGYEYFIQRGDALTFANLGSMNFGFNHGDRIGIRYDGDAGSITFYSNGVFGFTQNIGTGGVRCFPFAGHCNSGTILSRTTTNFGASTMVFAIPSGYNTLSSKPSQTTYNAKADFGSTNPNGVWRYGYALPVSSPIWWPFAAPTLHPYSNFVILPLRGYWYTSGLGTPLIERNEGTGSQYTVQPGQLAMHGGCPNQEWSVMSFTAPTSGTHRVTATFYVGDSGYVYGAVRAFPSGYSGSVTWLLNPTVVSTATVTLSDTDIFLNEGGVVEIAVGTYDGCTSDTTPVEFVVSLLGATSSTTADYVSVEDQTGRTFLNLTGSGSTAMMLPIDTGDVYVRFVTDSSMTTVGSGATLRYGCYRSQCSANITNVRILPQYVGQYNGVISSDTDGSGTQPYFHNENCNWRVQCPAGMYAGAQYLNLYFSSDASLSPGGVADFLNITGLAATPLIYTGTSTTVMSPTMDSTSTFTVQMVTNNVINPLQAQQGFSLGWGCYVARCSANVTGFPFSTAYPATIRSDYDGASTGSTYFNNDNCLWQVACSNGQARLSSINYALGAGDYINVNTGYTSVNFTAGSATISSFAYSWSPILKFSLVADAAQVGGGFSAVYNCYCDYGGTFSPCVDPTPAPPPATPNPPIDLPFPYSLCVNALNTCNQIQTLCAPCIGSSGSCRVFGTKCSAAITQCQSVFTSCNTQVLGA